MSNIFQCLTWGGLKWEFYLLSSFQFINSIQILLISLQSHELLSNRLSRPVWDGLCWSPCSFCVSVLLFDTFCMLCRRPLYQWPCLSTNMNIEYSSPFSIDHSGQWFGMDEPIMILISLLCLLNMSLGMQTTSCLTQFYHVGCCLLLQFTTAQWRRRDQWLNVSYLHLQHSWYHSRPAACSGN